jgi:hypothetical protein
VLENVNRAVVAITKGRLPRADGDSGCSSFSVHMPRPCHGRSHGPKKAAPRKALPADATDSFSSAWTELRGRDSTCITCGAERSPFAVIAGARNRAAARLCDGESPTGLYIAAPCSKPRRCPPGRPSRLFANWFARRAIPFASWTSAARVTAKFTRRGFPGCRRS